MTTADSHVEEEAIRLSVHVLCGAERTHWLNPTLVEGLVSLAVQRGNIKIGFQPIIDLKPVAFARNHACECALRSGANWILMVDCDQVLPLNFVDLVREADQTPGVDVVCAPTWQWSSHNNYPVLNVFENDRKERIVLANEPGFQEISFGGAGVLLIRADILQTLPQPWFYTPVDPQTSQALTSEDFYFCAKARAAGFRVFTHSEYPCGHLKTADLRNFAEIVAGKRNGWPAN